MSKQEQTSAPLALTTHEVPAELPSLYDSLQQSSGSALQAIMAGENHIERQWRLASRLCRQFLALTEEPAELALVSQLGDWEEARTSLEPPEAPYTYIMWLGAMAWRLQQFCESRPDFMYIEPVRHFARDGIIAVKTIPSLQRVVAQRALNGESKVEERVRGPKMYPAGKGPSIRLERKKKDKLKN